jgi:hypothetical protein
MPDHACGAKAAMLNNLAKQLPIPPIHPGNCPSAGTVCPQNSGSFGNADDIEDDMDEKRVARKQGGLS